MTTTKQFNGADELRKLEEKLAKEKQNIADKALAFDALPQAILDASESIHAGIYKNVLASVSLTAPTLSDAIELMETSNAIVSMLHTKGTFTSFVTADTSVKQGDTVTSIQPWVLDVDYLDRYGTTVKLRWYAEYGAHRFRFEAKIENAGKLPRIEADYRVSHGERYLHSSRLVGAPKNARVTNYAGTSDNPGNRVIYFASSANTAREDFADLL